MSRRNVVCLLCDQLRPDFLQVYGCDAVPTPNLNRLAQMGVTFDRAVSCSPVCSPARASWMTGRYPSDHGVWGNDIPFRDGLDYLPEKMNQHGYHTGCFGKLHHTPPLDTKGFRTARQMEENRLGEQDHYFQWLQRQCPERTDGTIWNFDADNLQFKLDENLHYEHWIASEAMSFMQSVSETGHEPFFAWVSFQGPHVPLNPPASVKGTVDPAKLPQPLMHTEGRLCPIHDYRRNIHPAENDTARIMRERTAYAECIVNIDRQIGRIIEHLEKIGEFERTTFIFSSDHGDLRGDFGLVGKGPFCFSGQLDVPLVVANHPDLRRGVHSAQLANNIDIPATVLDIAGGQQGFHMSRSLLDLAREQPEFPREMNFSEYGGATKIVEDSRYRFAYYPCLGYAELYDLSCDPENLQNLTEDTDKQELKVRFLQHIIDMHVLMKGLEVPGLDFVPEMQANARKKHPFFDDPHDFRAAFPLNKKMKEKLKKAGYDPNYTNWYKNHQIQADYGQDFEEF